MQFSIEIERESDGRWIAEIPSLPGILAYGRTEAQARAKAYALALRVIADRVEKSKKVPKSLSLLCASALLDQGFHLGGIIRASRDELHER